MSQKKITFTVGEEKKLRDLVLENDIMPLLRGVVNAGACDAALLDADNNVLWHYHSGGIETLTSALLPLSLEGEVVGAVAVKGHAKDVSLLNALATLIRDAISIVIQNNLKRLLATELHTTVVNQSYEELLETNAQLRASETKYKELAESLEQKVSDRTCELKQAHARLLQQEKMASVGQLAAGVAHEINTPLGYISSNLNTLRKYLSRLNEMYVFYNSCMETKNVPQTLQSGVQEKNTALKIDFILGDSVQLIEQSLNGTERVKKIIADLKEFSHVDEFEISSVDINKEIDKTLNVISHQIPASARVIKNYAKLSPFLCKPALLCQIFLNIIQNALQARAEGLELSISTEDTGEHVVIRFKDNGPGIPREIRNRIFDPFFTTKEVGKGTGMGLTVVYESVTSLGGSIALDEAEQSGACFSITLPKKGDRHV